MRKVPDHFSLALTYDCLAAMRESPPSASLVAGDGTREVLGFEDFAGGARRRPSWERVPPWER